MNTPNTFKVITFDHTDNDGIDRMYTLDAPQDWAEAHDDRVFDHDDERWEVVIDVEPAENEAPYVAAIEAAGLTIIGREGTDYIVTR